MTRLMGVVLWPIASIVAVLIVGLALLFHLLTLPGRRLLPREGRTTVDGVITLADAERVCRESGLTGWALVAFAQRLVARKFTYSRRNPWDTAPRAFERGMGYCQQQALALNLLLTRLGFRSRLVYATRVAFPRKVVHGVEEPAGVGGHTWLRVGVGGEERDVCPGNVANEPGRVHFKPLSPVKELTPILRPFTHLASVVVNVSRDRRSTGFRADGARR